MCSVQPQSKGDKSGRHSTEVNEVRLHRRESLRIHIPTDFSPIKLLRRLVWMRFNSEACKGSDNLLSVLFSGFGWLTRASAPLLADAVTTSLGIKSAFLFLTEILKPHLCFVAQYY